MSRCWSHPLLKCFVIAGYLLVTTVSGLLHDHGGCEHSTCCTHEDAQTVCSSGDGGQHTATPETQGEASNSHDEPKHTHRHKCCHHHHHAVAKASEAPAKGGLSVTAAKSEHGPCAVCQFLAHHHAVTPVETVTVAILPSPTRIGSPRAWQLAWPSVTHPARGPPNCA